MARLRNALSFGIACVLSGVSGADAVRGDEQAVVAGTEVGNVLPTTTTWVVLSPDDSRREGRNTCLAGVHRNQRAISLYCRATPAELWTVLTEIDKRLAQQPDVAAYVVIHLPLTDEQGINRSQERFDATRRGAEQRRFQRVSIALSRSGDGTSLLPADESLRIVYSDHRVVKLRRTLSWEEAPGEIRSVLDEILTSEDG